MYFLNVTKANHTNSAAKISKNKYLINNFLCGIMQKKPQNDRYKTSLLFQNKKQIYMIFFKSWSSDANHASIKKND